MPALIDLAGQRFGRLTVVEFTGRRGRGSYWRCACDCGRGHVAESRDLRRGDTTSCGCRKLEAVHGMTGTVEFRTWSHIKQRCHNPRSRAYPDYGGRGIKVCDRWLNSFEAFYADMGPHPGRGYSIERKDNDKGYSPDNCVWADWFTQANNRGNSLFIEHGGKRQTVAQWSRETGIPYHQIRNRLNQGLSPALIFGAQEAPHA